MPTYEYACPACGIVEAFQSIKEAPLSTCPACGRHGVTRMVSGGGAVIFKGKGFWETDYNRSKDYASKSKAESPATPDPSPAAQPKAAAQPKPTTGDAGTTGTT